MMPCDEQEFIHVKPMPTMRQTMPCRPLPAMREIVAAGEFSIAVIGRPLMDNVLGGCETVGCGSTGTTSLGAVGSGMGTACV